MGCGACVWDMTTPYVGFQVAAYTNGEHKDFTLVHIGNGPLSEVKATDPSIRGGKAQFT